MAKRALGNNSIPHAPPAARNTRGVIQHLPAVLGQYPGHALLLYNRVSSYEQAGKGKVKLAAKTGEVQTELDRDYPGMLWGVSYDGIEEGKLSNPRKVLRQAIRTAKRHRLILVASDTSRFIRSESYHRQHNNEAWPTPEEFARLRDIAGGVILATLAEPTLSESERHSRATKRSKKNGRPCKMKHWLALRILDEFMYPSLDERGRFVWDTSLSKVADQYGVSKGRVQRLLDSPVPGRGGKRWKEMANPARTYRECWEKGLLKGEPCPWKTRVCADASVFE